MNREAYLRQLQALLPPGAAWTREPDAVLTGVLDSSAAELERLDSAAFNLIEEADPRTSSLLLSDWERITGLPDPCIGSSATLQERRQALTDHLTRVGLQSRQFFIDLAARNGYVITITEFRPYNCEMNCELPVQGEDWAHAWRINAPATTSTETNCESSCEDPLLIFGNTRLECVIRRNKPAHTSVLFAYG